MTDDTLFSQAVMSTTELSNRLGFNVSVKFITSIGIEPAMKSHVAVYWLREDLPRIHSAIISHTAELQRAALENLAVDADPLKR